MAAEVSLSRAHVNLCFRIRVCKIRMSSRGQKLRQTRRGARQTPAPGGECGTVILGGSIGGQSGGTSKTGKGAPVRLRAKSNWSTGRRCTQSAWMRSLSTSGNGEHRESRAPLPCEALGPKNSARTAEAVGPVTRSDSGILQVWEAVMRTGRTAPADSPDVSRAGPSFGARLPKA